jgi:small subunit ribosomal protein S18
MSDTETKRRRPTRRKKPCSFCIEKATHIDFKDVSKLRRFVTERGKIMPRRMTGNCAQHQRQLSMAVKRARIVALLPYSID